MERSKSVDEIPGQQVVVAEDEIDRPDGKLQSGRGIDQIGQPRLVPALRRGQRVRVVADDVEDPEGEDRTADMQRQHAMHPLDQRQYLGEAVRIADVRRRAGAPLDVAHHHHAGFAVHDLGGDAGIERRPAGGELVEAHDLVDGNVRADTDDEAPSGVRHHEVDVGDAAAQPLGCNLGLPDRETGHRLRPVAAGIALVHATLTRRRP